MAYQEGVDRALSEIGNFYDSAVDTATDYIGAADELLGNPIKGMNQVAEAGDNPWREAAQEAQATGQPMWRRSPYTSMVGDAVGLNPDGSITRMPTEAPERALTSEEFEEHARRAIETYGLDPRLATDEKLRNIIARESKFQVGRPNYTYEGAHGRGQVNPRGVDMKWRKDNPYPRGTTSSDMRKADLWPQIWDELRSDNPLRARSTATGIGQLIYPNVKKYYPMGTTGIGDPYNEVAGALRYMADRHGTSIAALGKKNESGIW